MAKLTHLDDDGALSMVDVSGKETTNREATATGTLHASEEVIGAIQENRVAKGNVLEAARLAGILAAKQTGTLIPLCHPLPISYAGIEFALQDTSITVSGTVRTSAQTGVEMEALTAVTVALLTLYDMCKALDKTMSISEVFLREKKGGKSGHFLHPKVEKPQTP